MAESRRVLIIALKRAGEEQAVWGCDLPPNEEQAELDAEQLVEEMEVLLGKGKYDLFTAEPTLAEAMWGVARTGQWATIRFDKADGTGPVAMMEICRSVVVRLPRTSGEAGFRVS